ncbi:hypothetical protein [Leifsonia sp. 22587]|uniref:hypothetical protein n=1 Tax=Leifsonia sp. 22587 TaxID=3453946 RepID=UPI003F83861C
MLARDGPADVHIATSDARPALPHTEQAPARQSASGHDDTRFRRGSFAGRRVGVGRLD